MNWIGVITADIVDSTQILNSGHREKMLDTLHQATEDINRMGIFGLLRMEIHRGDSFQIVTDYRHVLNIAILVRAALITNSADHRWDCRLGIGVGSGEFMTKSIGESDGEAFRFSGKAFDSLTKYSRMAILTPDDDFNAELFVSIAFADNVISNWTVAQASVILPFGFNAITQKELARKVGKTPQTVNKLLSVGKNDLILNFETRFRNKILSLNSNV